jgi:predicted nuclease with TOPRIM domain
MPWDEYDQAAGELEQALPGVDHDGVLTQMDQQAQTLRGKAEEIEMRATEAVNELGPSPAAHVASIHAGRLRAQADDHEAQAAQMLQERLGPAAGQVRRLQDEWDEVNDWMEDLHRQLLVEAAPLTGEGLV